MLSVLTKDSIELSLGCLSMSINSDLLEILTKSIESNPSEYVLHLNNTEFHLSDVSITNSPTSVNEPTTRGGVYFSDKFAFKMTGVIKDLSVIPLLTKKMLGPNTEFSEIKITTVIHENENPLHFEIFTNLTNSVQTPDSIELSMIIIKLESI
jgi:hypothetical protein